MSLIQIAHLTFAYEGGMENIFEDVSFQLDTDWKLGFIGRNGRGKTTFLKLLLGHYKHEGTLAAKTDFEYFPYHIPDHGVHTAKVLQNISPDSEEWEITREISLLGIADNVLHRPFGTLSNGERTKVLLAALFLKKNSFLLIDEPTNHLDMEGRALVTAYLNRKKGFILVSHDRIFLDSCIDHILAINKKNIEIQKGTFSSWWQNKETRDASERSENERLRKEIERMREATRQTTDWSTKMEKTKRGVRIGGLRPDTGHIGHKAAKMARRSKSLERRQEEALERKSALLENVEKSEKLKIFPQTYHSPILARLEEISIRYGDRTVCSDINLTIRRGERIALRGKNGSGKSSILKLIRGECLEYGGKLLLGGGLRISYVPQSTQMLHGSPREYARECGIDESLFRTILSKLDFSKVQFEKEMGDYSGGQKKKVLLARSLCEQAHLYLWDEPLNYVDLFSRMHLTELLLKHKPTLLFVEHDRAFCDKVATETLSL